MDRNRSTILELVIVGLCLYIFASDTSAICGDLAARLAIPFSWLAQRSCIFIPVLTVLACIFRRRAFVLTSLMIGTIIFPVLVFSLGSRTISTSGKLSALSAELRAELGFPIEIQEGSGNSSIHFSRAHNPEAVRQVLRRHGVQPID